MKSVISSSSFFFSLFCGIYVQAISFDLTASLLNVSIHAVVKLLKNLKIFLLSDYHVTTEENKKEGRRTEKKNRLFMPQTSCARRFPSPSLSLIVKYPEY